MSLVMLETASDDLLRGARRVLPFALFAPLAVYVLYAAQPSSASFGDLISFYRSSAALWIGIAATIMGGVWEMLFTGPVRRADRLATARSAARASGGYRATGAYARGSDRLS